MSGMSLRRKGVVLVVVATVTSLVIGTGTLLAVCTAQIYRARQASRALCVTRALLDSGVAYARAHAAEWSADPPDSPVALDVTAILPTRMTGDLTLSFPAGEGRPYCRVFAHAKSGHAGAADQIDIALRP